MKVNVKFREYLMVEYLGNLARYGFKDAFLKFYVPMEETLIEMAKSSNDVNILSKINEIFAFRKKSMGKQM